MRLAVEKGDETVDVPRFIVAGTRSGVGKTTVAFGLNAPRAERGEGGR